MPKRIQRKRTKGWRMPKGALYVGRPTKWGNPFKAEDLNCQKKEVPVVAAHAYGLWLRGMGYHNFLIAEREILLNDLHELRGKDLACWCTIDQPCHADTLLELANQ